MLHLCKHTLLSCNVHVFSLWLHYSVVSCWCHMLCKLSLTFLLAHSILYQRMVLKNTNKTKSTVRKHWSYSVCCHLTQISCMWICKVCLTNTYKLCYSLLFWMQKIIFSMIIQIRLITCIIFSDSWKSFKHVGDCFRDLKN